MRAIGATRQKGLARALSKLGYCSRSRAAELIRAGRVSLNGKVRHDPETPVSGKRHQIAIDGKIIETQQKIYLMMNKPRGVVTTAADEKGRNTVYTLLAAAKNAQREQSPWVAPVGRLDKASEGLLLLTNDSEWGARITAPETHLDKTYHVQVAPHNPYGPVSTAACLHLCAAIPNFLILEYVWTNEPWRSRIQKGDPIVNRHGYLALPDAPGLGIDLDEAILASRPFQPFDVYRRFDADGAVADV